jgi:hypothetical protein
MAALEDHHKLLQGASMPSILLIDASRLSDLLWLRSPGTWADRLGALLKPEHTFVGVGIAALMQEPRLGLGVGEGATPTVRQSLIRWRTKWACAQRPRMSPDRLAARAPVTRESLRRLFARWLRSRR